MLETSILQEGEGEEGENNDKYFRVSPVGKCKPLSVLYREEKMYGKLSSQLVEKSKTNISALFPPWQRACQLLYTHNRVLQ